MKENYMIPEMEFVSLDSEDIITTSNENETPFEPICEIEP